MSIMYYPDDSEDLLRSIVALSQEFGSNPEYVLAGGGNTSVKTKTSLFVKASGTQLATIEADGFVEMSRAKLDEIWNTKYPEAEEAREKAVLADMMDARSVKGDTRRPSVEALLHDLFPYRYVVHTHPTKINGITCAAEGERWAKLLLGRDIIWVPVIDPGYILAREVRRAIEAEKLKRGLFPKVVLLQNHGIFVASNQPTEIREIYQDIFRTIEKALQRTASTVKDTPATDITSVLDAVEKNFPGSAAIPFSNPDLTEFSASTDAFAELRLAPTPDHIVYAGYRPLFIEDPTNADSAIREFLRTESVPPRIIVVKGVGAIARGETVLKASLARQLFEDNLRIAIYAQSFGGLQFMPDENIAFIRNWEVEKYRASVSS